MLDLIDVDVFYGPAQALFGIGFSVGRGEAAALLGRNGAGKSTTLKAIIGLTPPAAGVIVFNGQRRNGLEPHVLARAGIGYVPEGRRIFTGLTVAENLEVGRRRSSDAAAVWTTDRVYALFPALAELRHRRGGQLSGGEQQMLTIARTLMGNPRLLLLDEPVTGLAPKIADDLAAAVRALRDHGLTILVSEQSLAFAAAVADFALVLETGRLRWQGAMADFVADAAAQQALLGI